LTNPRSFFVKRRLQIDGRILLDIQQVVPLPDAGEYQVRIGRKLTEQQRRSSDNRDWTRYHVVVDGLESEELTKRHAVRQMIQNLVDKGVPTAMIGSRLTPGRFRRLDGDRPPPVQAELVVDWALSTMPPRAAGTRVLEEPWTSADSATLLSF
jgi:hypothetical protein